MRIGTFWCYIWGHQFAKEIGYFESSINQFKYCVRCGIDKPNN